MFKGFFNMVCEDNSTISVEPHFKKTQKFDTVLENLSLKKNLN